MSESSNLTPGKSLESDLRLIREAKGLTREDVFNRVHIRPEVLSQVEEFGFAATPTLSSEIHRRSFVKHYAEAIGIDTATALDALTNSLGGSYDGALAREYLSGDGAARQTAPRPKVVPASTHPARARPVKRKPLSEESDTDRATAASADDDEEVTRVTVVSSSTVIDDIPEIPPTDEAPEIVWPIAGQEPSAGEESNDVRTEDVTQPAVAEERLTPEKEGEIPGASDPEPVEVGAAEVEAEAVEPVEPVAAEMEVVEPVNAEAEAVEPVEEDLEPVEPVAAEMEVVEPVDGEAEVVEPVEEALEPVEPITAEMEVVEPANAEAEVVEPVEKDLELVEPIIEEVEAVEPVDVEAEAVPAVEEASEAVKPIEAEARDLKPDDVEVDSVESVGKAVARNVTSTKKKKTREVRSIPNSEEATNEASSEVEIPSEETQTPEQEAKREPVAPDSPYAPPIPGSGVAGQAVSPGDKPAASPAREPSRRPSPTSRRKPKRTASVPTPPPAASEPAPRVEQKHSSERRESRTRVRSSHWITWLGLLGVLVVVGLFLIRSFTHWLSVDKEPVVKVKSSVSVEVLPKRFSGVIRLDDNTEQFVTLLVASMDSLGSKDSLGWSSFQFKMWTHSAGSLYATTGEAQLDSSGEQVTFPDPYGTGGVFVSEEGELRMRSVRRMEYPRWEFTGHMQ